MIRFLAHRQKRLRNAQALDSKNGTPIKAALPKAAEVIDALVRNREAHCAVILGFASRIQELCAENGNDVSEFFYYMFRLMQDASPKMIKSDVKENAALYSPLIWIIDIVQLAKREGLKFNEIGKEIRRYKLDIMENLRAKLDCNRISHIFRAALWVSQGQSGM